MRDYIGIVLESKEVVICDYKGHELCRKSFEKRIVNLDVFATTFLLQFEDNSIEVYHLEEHSMELKMREQFSSPIKKAEISGMWIEEAPILVVLLENGDLYSSKDLLLPEEIVKIDDHVKTEACLVESIVYITNGGEVKKYLSGSPYSPAPEINRDVALDIETLNVAQFNGDYGYLGIGKKSVYYLNGVAPLCLNSTLDISEIDPRSVLSGKTVYFSIMYQENRQWYFEGVTRDYKHYIFRETKKKIRVEEGESVLPIPGGVIFYTDHEVRVRLI
ncbi:MAG: hypothetical protein J6Y58_07360 [Clostridiales bacterium]|nr:hypothetical protein [Clostridiales bacterium]